MQCKHIKKDGSQCKNSTHYGCKTCRYHGARPIKYGKEAPNYKHGDYTKAAYVSRKTIRLLTYIGNTVGFIKPKMRGRRAYIKGLKV